MRLLIIGHVNNLVILEAGKIAKARGAKVTIVSQIDEALYNLRTGKGADLIFIDIALHIERLMNHLESEHFSIPVIACGNQKTTSKDATHAIDIGANEYIPLPPNPDLIAAILTRISGKIQTPIYASAQISNIIKIADQIAPSQASVLITGESGTGKEVFSQYIHQKSPRASQTFIAINCAAIPENLLESELFGHEKGAFSGAIARRIGKFEEANEGTILLDEISEMDLKLQAKLLRVLQEKEITRIGSNESIPINVRILATSNRNMTEIVREKKFREDLFFRLNVITIAIPPLRKRTDDIIPLAQHFLSEYCQDNRFPKKLITEQAIAKLQAYHWPGNVRELSNTIYRAVLLSDQEITDQHITFIDETELLNKDSIPVGKTIAEVERTLILNTVHHYFTDHHYAAKILGITIHELQNKLNRYKEEGFC